MLICPFCEEVLRAEPETKPDVAVDVLYGHYMVGYCPAMSFLPPEFTTKHPYVCVCGQDFMTRFSLENGLLYHLARLTPEEADEHRALMLMRSINP